MRCNFGDFLSTKRKKEKKRKKKEKSAQYVFLPRQTFQNVYTVSGIDIYTYVNLYRSRIAHRPRDLINFIGL